jgi:cation transport regulator ChaC
MSGCVGSSMKIGSVVRLRDGGTINGILLRIIEDKWAEIYFNVRTVIYPLDTLEVVCEGR